MMELHQQALGRVSLGSWTRIQVSQRRISTFRTVLAETPPLTLSVSLCRASIDCPGTGSLQLYERMCQNLSFRGPGADLGVNVSLVLVSRSYFQFKLTIVGVYSVVRMGVTALGCVVWLRASGDPHPYLGPPGVRFLLCIRGIVGFFGTFKSRLTYHHCHTRLCAKEYPSGPQKSRTSDAFDRNE